MPLHGDNLKDCGNSVEELVFYFQGSTYNEIKQIREMSWEGYISYAGGYMGLFLGLGIMQIPGLLLTLSKKVQTLMRNRTGIRGSRDRKNTQ